MVDCVILNDWEIRQLTDEPNLVRAARAVLAMGPRVVIAKQGEYGSALFTADDVFALPAFPTPDVVDPTGAGDTFAGGFVGYVAAHGDSDLRTRWPTARRSPPSTSRPSVRSASRRSTSRRSRSAYAPLWR